MMNMTQRGPIIFATIVAVVLGIFSAFWFVSGVVEPVVHAQALPNQKSFMVFDGTMYAGKPDLSVYSIRPISIAYTGQFGNQWYKNPDALPDKSVVRQVANEALAKNFPVVIDIEHWPLVGDPNRVRASLSKYMTVLQWFKEAAPGLPVGYYGAPPIRDYWKSLRSPMSKEWASFAKENDQLRPLAGAVDILFPSLYTFYTDQGGWVRYAYAQIAEARRNANGKPVYVFLWPQYHDSNPSLKGAPLPADFWRLQLQMAKQYADGIVIWGGWGTNGRMNWDDNAAWWKVTKDFMKKLPPAQP
ncbi:hypothetical protein IT404_12830 [Candidatus Nomurabacteria bacterium]|nr:hypothetical protein [Candidatus Nomurabacteria bacterium]